MQTTCITRKRSKQTAYTKRWPAQKQLVTLKSPFKIDKVTILAKGKMSKKSQKSN